MGVETAGKAWSREEVADEVRGAIAELFGVPLEAITEETAVEDLEGWDSTSHVGLLLQLEGVLGREFDIEDATAFKTVGELIDASLRLTGGGAAA